MSASDAVFEVRLGEVLVGHIERRNEGSEFSFDPAYAARANRPVLGQVYEDNLDGTYYVGQGVYRWFENLLPEGALREMVARRAGVHEARSLFLLGLLGADLPGAVVVAAADLEAHEPLERTSDSHTEAARSDTALLKFSLAGVQLKFSVVVSGDGITVPTEGLGGSYIAKLPGTRFQHVPEVEHATLLWAREAGITAAEARLVPTSRIVGLPAEAHTHVGNALVVRRFDREGADRVHIEDFAQVVGVYPRDKYEQANYETLARIVHATTDGVDVEEFIRRLTFNVLIGNGDAHLKNWSLMYPDGHGARLSPAYDLIPTVLYMPADDKLALNLGGVKRFGDIDRAVFGRLAERSKLDPLKISRIVAEQSDRTRSAWRQVRSEMPSDEFRTRIDAWLDGHPLR